MDELVEANNNFALDLYARFKESDGNVFFSPYSITTALGMALEGARGETAEEIRDTLHLTMSDEERRSAVEALHQQLNPEDAAYTLNAANAMWVQQDYQLLQEYVDLVTQVYSSEAHNVDFVGATENTRHRINEWVEDRTNDKIKELLKQGSINDATRLVLTNAIYFKGIWEKQFEEELTHDEPFWLDDGSSIDVPLMRNTELSYGYAATLNLQALEMAYEGGDLSMLVLLPKSDLASLEESLDTEMLSDLRDQMANRRVNVYIPKFTFTSNYGLRTTLQSMGMPLAFSSEADFSGINGKQDLKIDDVIHQAFVEVNEEGTEAAAATAVVMRAEMMSATPPPVPEFHADHPFLFLIQERQSGNILFMGRVENPQA